MFSGWAPEESPYAQEEPSDLNFLLGQAESMRNFLKSILPDEGQERKRQK